MMISRNISGNEPSIEIRPETREPQEETQTSQSESERKRSIDRWSLAAIGVIIFATLLRLFLIAMNWPQTNSDEGTMALMAINIAYHGQHPYIYYGQNYMGVTEAYLGAVFFHLLGGPSLFALRLGQVLLTTLFLISSYFLARIVFNKQLALLAMIILSLGSIYTLTRELIATGGSTQTLLFGSSAFLYATLLGRTYKRKQSPTERLLRLAGYGLYGLIAGLAIWSDMIVLPYLAMSFMLLVVFCWREMLVWGGWLTGLIGALIGLTPTILYYKGSHLNPIQIVLGLAQGSNATAPTTLYGILHNIKNTIQISIPTSTGLPFCPVNEIRLLGDNAAHTHACAIIHAAWGGSYVLLLAIAFLFALTQLLYVWHIRKKQETHPLLVNRVAHFLLVTAALLNVAAFTLSSGPVSQPSFHARYLIGLLIATPAIVAPLWEAANRKLMLKQNEKRACYIARASLALILFSFCIGTSLTLSKTPEAWDTYQLEVNLIANLEKIRATHVYTEYWTCNTLAFTSDERVVCSVIDANLQSTHNRVPGLNQMVLKDRYASWMCPTNPATTTPQYDCLPALKQKFSHEVAGAYHDYIIDGYMIYQPLKVVNKTTVKTITRQKSKLHRVIRQKTLAQSKNSHLSSITQMQLLKNN